MLLFVPSLLIALAVLAWIAWLALGPHSVPVPPPLSLFDASQRDSGSGAVDDSTPLADVESDYRQHVRERLEPSQSLLGSVSGVTAPSGSRIAPRDSSARGEVAD